MEPFDLANLGSIAPDNPNNALQADDPKLQPFLYFTTKDEYLEWRTDWKERYADLSQRIREARKVWRAEGSDHEFKNHQNLFRWRALARTMLTLRHASKVRAQELYLAGKEATQVA